MTMTPTHLVEVVTDGIAHRPRCSCGWCGDWTDDQTAELAGVEHRDGEVGPPDAVDVCLSGLLDLQDDIAQVVIWLAENWAADLPAPGWYGGSSDADDRPVVTVFVPCLRGDELERIAGVLGVAPVEDERPDTRGNRYRRAVRPFGRVVVTASLMVEGVLGAQ